MIIIVQSLSTFSASLFSIICLWISFTNCDTFRRLINAAMRLHQRKPLNMSLGIYSVLSIWHCAKVGPATL